MFKSQENSNTAVDLSTPVYLGDPTLGRSPFKFSEDGHLTGSQARIVWERKQIIVGKTVHSLVPKRGEGEDKREGELEGLSQPLSISCNTLC